jgi:uncharacterized damage-inducible protein DinB
MPGGCSTRDETNEDTTMTNQQFFAQTFAGEFDRFHNVLAAVPELGLDYKPDPKSRTARELMGHLIGHVQDLIELVDDGVINHRMHVPFGDPASGVALFDEAYTTLLGKLGQISDETWAKPAEFLGGGQLIMTAPTQALMWMLLLDSVHHRGQLSTYLRPMGSKCPNIYGPSADQPMPAH